MTYLPLLPAIPVLILVAFDARAERRRERGL